MGEELRRRGKLDEYGVGKVIPPMDAQAKRLRSTALKSSESLRSGLQVLLQLSGNVSAFLVQYDSHVGPRLGQ